MSNSSGISQADFKNGRTTRVCAYLSVTAARYECKPFGDVRVHLTDGRVQVKASTAAVNSTLHGALSHVGKVADTHQTHDVAWLVQGTYMLAVGNRQHRHERLRRVPCPHYTITKTSKMSERSLYIIYVKLNISFSV